MSPQYGRPMSAIHPRDSFYIRKRANTPGAPSENLPFLFPAAPGARVNERPLVKFAPYEKPPLPRTPLSFVLFFYLETTVVNLLPEPPGKDIGIHKFSPDCPLPPDILSRDPLPLCRVVPRYPQPPSIGADSPLRLRQGKTRVVCDLPGELPGGIPRSFLETAVNLLCGFLPPSQRLSLKDFPCLLPCLVKRSGCKACGYHEAGLPVRAFFVFLYEPLPCSPLFLTVSSRKFFSSVSTSSAKREIVSMSRAVESSRSSLTA